MATKRMFSNIVIDSDLFLDLSPMQQLLYFHCGMKTDDDGFVSGAKRIARIIGATDDDFSALVENGFLIEFPASKVYCIVHHKQNNDLKNDRYHPTNYQKEFSQLELTDNKELRLKNVVSNKDTDCIQPVSDEDTERNPSYPTVINSNGTNVIIEEGSDEGGNMIPVDPELLLIMTDKEGISRQIMYDAFTEIGVDATYQAYRAWKGDNANKKSFGKYIQQRKVS